MQKLRKDAEGGPLMPSSLLALAESGEVPILREEQALHAFMAGDGDHPARRPTPSIPTEGLVQLVAACLVWASRDLDGLLARHPWRQRLEQIAAELGVLPHLPTLPLSTP